MVLTEKLVVDENKIKKAILSGLPLTITTFTLPREIEVYIEEVLTIFLKMSGQENLKDYIFYCLQELAANAKKANTKRVYFTERGLDLFNPDEYREGMEEFKKNTLGNITHFLQLQKEKGLYVKLILQMRENIIQFEIRNNAAITRNELIRIHDRLARSRQYNDLNEALAQVLDDSEGAGLGLVILVLMLKKIGLDEDCFDIRSNDKETIARLMVPLDQVRVENISVLSEAIVNSVSALPRFPENILEVQRLIDAPEADMAAVAKQLSMDPALTSDLLRIVNSAQYMLIKRVENIFEAVKMVGIRGIKNLLYSSGTQRILGADTAEKKRLWEHSYRAAFYAYNLAKNFKAGAKDRGLLDDAYVSGILHDMGKIVFTNVHPELLESIKRFCVSRNIPISTLEDLSAGMNHAGIGALIAEKWNFPGNLVMAIRYHHTPLLAPKECRDLVECVYFANMMCEYESGSATFDQFERIMLENFGVSTQKNLDTLIERFSEGFKRDSGL